ncbi:MAG TPA: hypothetical protein VI461_03275 [Chitinophagaceae bacterium]|nr:hypothetical protein [Chitinophagaceae bacterium]
MDSEKQNETEALIRWTYSRDEWQAFMRWKKKRRGFFHYLLHRLSPGQKLRSPEITITSGRVSIGDNHEPFVDGERQLKRINIHDTGNMNVMEITYQRNGLQNAGPGEIHIPVPKGKLKEAIQVQEKLLGQQTSYL